MFGRVYRERVSVSFIIFLMKDQQEFLAFSYAALTVRQPKLIRDVKKIKKNPGECAPGCVTQGNFLD